jgi:radical SAM protein with 4Fe4S-binding SPASM domain
LYISSKGRKITPNKATCDLITLCDGVHTFGEIASHFVKISGEPPSLIKEQLKKILHRLFENEVIQFSEVPMPRDMVSEVELVHPLENITMEITDMCNLNCMHCYNNSHQKRKDELSLEEIYQLIDEIKRLGALKICLSGGEPLMHPHFFEIAYYIRDNSLGLELFTNGTLLTKETVKKLKDLNVLKVSVSLDSLTPEIHDSFRGKKGAWIKTMEGIRNLKTEGVNINPAISVSSLNLDEVVPLLKFFLKEGFQKYSFMPVFATGRKTPLKVDISPDDFEKALKKLYMWQKSHNITFQSFIKREGIQNCGIGCSSLVVKSNGDVVPCPAFGKHVVLGTIRDQSLKDIWNDSVVLNTLRHLDVENHPVCRTCHLVEYCKGGCIANVYLKTGNLQVCDPFKCASMRALEYARNFPE